MANLIIDPKSGLFVRPDTCDVMVIGEIDRSYKLLNLNPEDVVLDIGGNIGAFAAWASKRCSQVISYEPDEDNFDVLQANIKNLSNVGSVRAAVVSSNCSHAEFFINDSGRNKGLHSLVIQRGRRLARVPATNFNAEVTHWRPTALKIDIEGGEYDLLLDNPLPDHVKKIALEIHLQKKSWRYDQAPRLIQQLEAQFTNVLVKAHVDEKNRATLGVYSR